MAPASRLDLSSGRLIGTVCTGFYMVFCLTWTLITRLFLKSYYWSANATFICFFVGLTLLLHCTRCPEGVWARMWPKRRGWNAFSEIYMFLMWVVLLLLFLLFASVAGMKPTANKDAVICACIYGIAFVLVGVSHVITSAEQKLLASTYTPPLVGDARRRSNGEGSTGTQVRCRRCLRRWHRCTRLVVTAVLLVALVLYFIVAFFSLYEVIGVVRDWNLYRPSRYLYTVKVGKHMPAAFYLRCDGSGPRTFLMEQGLMGMALMAREFIPRNLSLSGWRACVYDRRGIGWSDPIETDSLAYATYPQTSETNIVFLKALVDAANLSRPFVLGGHSYGGWHITRYALAYPDDVEALVYIDSSRFYQTNEGAQDQFSYLMLVFELLSNAIPTGLARLAIDTGIVHLFKEFSGYMDFSDLTIPTRHEIAAVMLGGTFMSRGPFERRYIFTGKPSLKNNPRVSDLAARLPILLIDTTADWFPKPKNVSSAYTFVRLGSATHWSIVYSKQWGFRVAEEIRRFAAKFGSD